MKSGVSQIRAFSSFYKRHSKNLTVNRQMTENLTVNLQKGLFSIVNVTTPLRPS